MPDLRGVSPVHVGTSSPASDPTPTGTPRRDDPTTPDLPPAVHRSTPSHSPTRPRGGPRSLLEAVNDPRFVARDPATIPVPAELLAALEGAKRVLLIGHTDPDGDAAGSTLALARLLESLGKRVDVCIDDQLPGGVRALDHERRIKRAGALADERWDLALVVDVAQKTRIGGAAALLQRAATVGVVDHHVADPQAETFDLPPSTRYLRWVEPDFPASGLQVMAIMSRFLDAARQRRADLAAVYTPALAAFVSDTGFGRYPNLDPEYFRYFKHALQQTARLRLDEIEAALRFSLPEPVDALIDGRVRAGATRLAKKHKDALLALERQAKDTQVETWTTASGGAPALAILSVSDAYLTALTALGSTGLDSPPAFVRDDLVNALKWGPAARLRKSTPLVVLLIEEPGGIKLSARGQDDRARRLAEALGGGGHDTAAGALLHGVSLAEARTRVLEWVRAHAPGGLRG